MYPMAFIATLLFVLGFISSMNYERAIVDGRETAAMTLGMQLRVYSKFIGAYASANPSVTGEVSDATAGVPSWHIKVPGMRNYVQGGQAFIYYTGATLAEANAAARTCDALFQCGVTNGGRLYVPGRSGPVTTVTVPAAVPATGALLVVR